MSLKLLEREKGRPNEGENSTLIIFESHMAGSSGDELCAPVYNAELRFRVHSIENHFKSHNLWDYVESGFEIPEKEEMKHTLLDNVLFRKKTK